MIKTYRKKPVVIQAVEFTRNNFEEVVCFTEGKACNFKLPRGISLKATCTIPTLEGDHTALEGDYIIRGVKGEFYPCKPDIFLQTYELAEETTV